MNHEEIEVAGIRQHAHTLAVDLVLEVSPSGVDVEADDPLVGPGGEHDVLLLHSGHSHDRRRMEAPVQRLWLPRICFALSLLPQHHCVVAPASHEATLFPRHEAYVVDHALHVRLVFQETNPTPLSTQH